MTPVQGAKLAYILPAIVGVTYCGKKCVLSLQPTDGLTSRSDKYNYGPGLTGTDHK